MTEKNTVNGDMRYRAPRSQNNPISPKAPAPPNGRRRGPRAAWFAGAALVVLVAACLFLVWPEPLSILPDQIRTETTDTGELQFTVAGAYTQSPDLCGLILLSETQPGSARLAEPRQNADGAWVFTADLTAQPPDGAAAVPFALFGHTLLLGDALPILPPQPVITPTAAPSQPAATQTPMPTAAPTQAPTFTPTREPTPAPTAAPAISPAVTVSPAAQTATPAPTFFPQTAAPAQPTADGEMPKADAFQICPPAARYYYHQLSAAQQEIFTLLYDGVSAFEDSISFSKRCTQADLERAMYVILYDCPELFQLEGHYSYASDAQDRVASLSPTYQMTETEYGERLRQTLAVIDALPGLPANGDDPYELELAVYRALKTFSVYDDQKPFCGSSFSPYVNGYAKCDGYAQALLFALRRYGIPCAMVSGDATDRNDNNSTAAHSWNYVQIDGEWYHCDGTWDDVDIADANADFRGYLPYFNLTDAEMLKTRTIYPQDSAWELPVCTATAANYFAREGCVIADGEDLGEAVLRLFTRAYGQGVTEFPVSFQSEAMYLRLKDEMGDLLRQWEQDGARLRSWYYLVDDNVWLVYFYDVQVTR